MLSGAPVAARDREEPLTTGGEASPLLAELIPLFHRAETIVIVAAFVQDSGLRTLESRLLAALRRGASGP